jgi:mannose-6-phosphate isomerase-like protein (cupin superfamily)
MKSVVNKPWGYFEIFDEGDKYTVKKIVVHPEGKLSLQSHEHRSEHWLIARGVAEVIIDGKTHSLKENDNIFIPRGYKHRLTNIGSENLIVIEMWFGDKLDENDIKRYDDIYNRDP